MLWFLVRFSAQLVPSRPGSVLRYLIHLVLQSFWPFFSLSLISPPISLIFRAVICSQLFQLKCGYSSGLLVLLADEARLSSSPLVLGPPGGSPWPPNFPSKRHGKLSASDICGTAWRKPHRIRYCLVGASGLCNGDERQKRGSKCKIPNFCPHLRFSIPNHHHSSFTTAYKICEAQRFFYAVGIGHRVKYSQS
jgi:hypothetical protein